MRDQAAKCSALQSYSMNFLTAVIISLSDGIRRDFEGVFGANVRLSSVYDY
jgi:hypothetical protein